MLGKIVNAKLQLEYEIKNGFNEQRKILFDNLMTI